MQKLFLDIETIPAEEKMRQTLKMLYDKKVKKAKNGVVHEDFEQFLLNTCFDGAYGRIICIAYATNDDPVKSLCYDPDEAETLRQFWGIAGRHNLFIGHNVMDFDLRFIYQRSIVHRVRPTHNLSFARYRDYPIYDTMREWGKWSGTSVGLEYLALALGIPTPKQGIDGAHVFEFYQQGKLDEIVKYCQRDVETTRLIYKRMIFEENG